MGEHPVIIQGGMGVAVSSWRLARAVSRTGELGVVSGTALDIVVTRRLQDGDPGGHVRRALAAFPVPEIAQWVLDRYYRPDGRAPGQSYRMVPKLTLRPTVATLRIAVVANFVEVWLAKEGHDGLVGINYLEKVQMATPPAALGAMLAGVDYVLMGAGVPREIPRLLDELAAGKVAGLPVEVTGADAPHLLTVDPEEVLGGPPPELRRPTFLAIVSSHVLANYLARDPAIRPDGFVVEGVPAGGHNAPPRGELVLDDDGQPVYGPRDDADLVKLAALSLPFWLAGGHGSPDGLAAAHAAGAVGVQVGSLFALSQDSGLDPDLLAQLQRGLRGAGLTVRTHPAASPTGFPFKVTALPETLSEDTVYEQRERLCDLGYLRTPYVAEEGRIGYRCAAEPVADYVRKGGDAADTEGRRCLCNALTADVGLGQTRRNGYQEPALVTLGSDLAGPRALAAERPDGWTAEEAVAWLRQVPVA